MKTENFTDINTALPVKILQAAQVNMNPLFSRYSSEVLVPDRCLNSISGWSKQKILQMPWSIIKDKENLMDFR
jgi:hypothetical protein